MQRHRFELSIIIFDCNESFSYSLKEYGTNDIFILGEPKKILPLAGCGIKSMRPIFKTEMLIYQSKANLDEAILFGKITHYVDLEIRKMLSRSMFVNEYFTCHSGP